MKDSLDREQVQLFYEVPLNFVVRRIFKILSPAWARRWLYFDAFTRQLLIHLLLLQSALQPAGTKAALANFDVQLNLFDETAKNVNVDVHVLGTARKKYFFDSVVSFNSL